jgi:hypothetical protein
MGYRARTNTKRRQALDEPDPGSRRGALAALILVVVLLVGGIWLMRHLRATAALQDCVMAGRTNCAPITPGNT